MTTDDGLEGYRGDLHHRCVTIVEALGATGLRSDSAKRGYRTYMSGKWHISRHMEPDGPKHSWPRQRGFDRYFGILTGAANYWKPNTLTRDNNHVSHDELPDDFFLTDAISDEASKFIREHHAKSPGEPFSTYVAYTAPHGHYMRMRRRLRAMEAVSPLAAMCSAKNAFPAYARWASWKIVGN